MVERGLSASECPVCYDGLGPERVPYSLSCCHTVCWLCVKRLGEGVKHFSCPLCREKVPVSDVKRNVTLLQLITQLNQGVTPPFSRALTTPFESIELGQCLDRGASGEVYRGFWQGNDVAIKIFSSGQLSKDAHDSFHREVCIMNTLRHPNVVLLLAASPSPPKLAIVMEYVSGGSLYSHLYIEKTPLSVESMAQILADVTRGLQYLHSINILHRDLKSKNVLLTAPPPIGRGKLCDFGLARMRLESASMTGNIGTIHWTAPEVLNCGRYHFSADIYSFGMVVYEVISRSIPFSNLPPPAVIVAVLIRRDKPVPPTDSHPTLLGLFDECTSWEPTKRPSIISILQELTPLLFLPTVPSQDDTNNDGFDYADSLGHVTLDFELGDEEDEELMKFLQGQLDNKEEEEEEEEEEANQDDPSPPLERSTNNDQNVYEDTRGVLSQQELEDYHNLSTESNDHYSTSDTSTDQSNVSWRRRSYMYNVPSLVPANSLRSQNTNRISQDINVPSNDVSKLDTTTTTASSFHSEMQDFLMDSDRALALRMQMEEHKNLLQNDYVLASEMQEREQISYRGPRPPPPPIPPPVPLPAKILTLSDKQHMVLSQVRRSGYHKRVLKHVEPVEKKAFRVGRVLDNEVKNNEPVFTLQKEIAAFPKKLLFQIDFKEPKPPFPVGRVINNRGRVHKEIHRLNSLTQSQILNFGGNQSLKHVKTDEKNLLPTSEDITAERKLSDSNPPAPPTLPPVPPTPPPAPPIPLSASPTSNNTEPMKIKSKILSPLKKKGTKKKADSMSPRKQMMSKSLAIEPPMEEIYSKGPSIPFTKQAASKGYSKKYVEEVDDYDEITPSKVGPPIVVTKKLPNKSYKLKVEQKPGRGVVKESKTEQKTVTKVVSPTKGSGQTEEEFVIVPDPTSVDKLTITEKEIHVHKTAKKGKKKK